MSVLGEKPKSLEEYARELRDQIPPVIREEGPLTKAAAMLPPAIRGEPSPVVTVRKDPNDGFFPRGEISFGTSPPTPESVLQEAHRLTHGPRQADYSHPLDDYTRTAGMVNAMLAHKLKEPLLPEEVTLIMCLVKISRQVHRPKRDNMVDNAGYSWCTDDIIEERKRRAAK